MVTSGRPQAIPWRAIHQMSPALGYGFPTPLLRMSYLLSRACNFRQRFPPPATPNELPKDSPAQRGVPFPVLLTRASQYLATLPSQAPSPPEDCRDR